LTRSPDNVVHLSVKDWLGIAAITFTILSSTFAVYLHHDRQLTEVLTRQQTLVDRVERIENSLDKGQRP
jgi:hypothetical protein